MKKVYLDYASTAPVDPAVLKAMEPYFREKFGNPGAMHHFGQEAQAAVDSSRQKIADFFGCQFEEIIFTGSATESNNLAMRGIVKHFSQNVRGLTPHIVTSAVEHKSVLETCRSLEKEGVEVTYLPAAKDGFVRPGDVEAAIKENTVLISIMYVNNEIGTVQPIGETAKAIGNFKRSKSQFPLFHTDAVQALNYLDCNVENLGVDLLTFSGHKIYGPKGIGGLYVKKSILITPIITGGNQEWGLRSGTENVPYIVGLGKAAEIAEKMRKKESVRLSKLRDYFIDEVLGKIPGAQLNGSRENRIANNANFLFRGASANNLLIALDQEGIAASSGSTCTIKTVTPSEVLLALGRSEEEAKQSIRFTLGRGTTREDIDYTVSMLEKIGRRI
ncbi:MAG: cysteine desulfurase family protein [Candidatus Spechtbacterales bacterium]